MARSANEIIPARATHPGSVLKSELKARGIKQKDFAKSLGMSAPNLSEIIRGRRPVTEAIAIKLESALGISYQIWVNLQSRYNYVSKHKETATPDQEFTVINNCYSKLMNGFEPSSFISSQWPMQNGMYVQYSGFQDSTPCIAGTSESVKANTL